MMTGRMLLLIISSSVLRVSVTVLRGGAVCWFSPEDRVTGGSVSISEDPAQYYWVYEKFLTFF